MAAVGLTQLPTTTRKVVAKHVGGSFREVATVVEEPLPELGPGDVLVRVKHVGINAGCETFRARGEFWFNGEAPGQGLAYCA